MTSRSIVGHIRISTLLWLLAFTIIGVLLRIWGIGHNSLWFDEIFSRNVAVLSDIPTIAREGVAGDIHPPLYFMLLNAWVTFTGDNVVSLRMLSALFALLALPAYYHLGRLLFSPRVGKIALLLGALAPFQTYYAQEARQYMLSVLLMAWAALGLVAMLRHKRYGWLLYVIAATLGLYTHYFIGLSLAAIHLWLLLHRPARSQWKVWLSADIVIVLLFAPQMMIFARQAQTVLGGFWIDKPNPAAPITTLTFLSFATTLPGGVAEVIAVILSICIVILSAIDVLRKAPRKIRPYWWLCLLTILGPLAVVMLISLARSSIYLDRSFGMLAPFLIVLIAAGAAYARPPSPVPILVTGLVGLMLFGTSHYLLLPDIRKPPYKDIAAQLTATPAEANLPLVYLHDSAYLSINYYAPTLANVTQVIDLDTRSWLLPRTWEIFGLRRVPRADLSQQLTTQRGKFRVVVTASLEPPEITLIRTLMARNCVHTSRDYPPALAIFTFDCP